MATSIALLAEYAYTTCIACIGMGWQEGMGAARKCGALDRKRRRWRLMLDASLVECTPNVWRALLLKYKTANINVKNF